MSGADPHGFRRAGWGWFALLDGGIVALTVLATNGDAYGRVASRVPLPQRGALRALLAATFAIHVTEGAVAATLASRRGLPPGKWALQTFVVGFPSLIELRRIRRTIRSGG